MQWALAASLALICCVVAVLQYRRIGEVSRAEETRRRASLQAPLQSVARDFDTQLAAATAALLPASAEVDSMGREAAYSARFAAWRAAARDARLLRRVAVAVPRNGNVELLLFDNTGALQPATWPQPWHTLRNSIQARLAGGPPPQPPEIPPVVEIPRFAAPAGPRAGLAAEQDWLILELDSVYLRETLLPAMLDRHLGASWRDYQVEVLVRAMPNAFIFRSPTAPRDRIRDRGDASAALFSRMPPGARPGQTPGPAGARWEIRMRHLGGSADAAVASAGRRNLLISAAILLLLLAAAVLLVRMSRRLQPEAE